MSESEPLAVRGRAPARRRRQRRDRARGTLRGVGRPRSERRLTQLARAAHRDTAGPTRSPARPTRSRRPPTATPGSDDELTAMLDEIVAEAAAAPPPPPLALVGAAGAARQTARGAPDARELPHRRADRLHARADALGPAPGRVPARPRRRRLPAPHRRATATTCCSPIRTSATATRAPRTGRCCSTRCSRPRDPDRHLQRQRRADERGAARRRSSVGELLDASTRPRASAATATGPRPGRHRTTRCSRSTPRNFTPDALVPGGTVELRRGRAGGSASARAHRARTDAAVPRRAAPDRRAGGRSSLEDLVALRAAPGARVPAPAARDLDQRAATTR